MDRLTPSTSHRLVQNPDRWHLAMSALRLRLQVEAKEPAQPELPLALLTEVAKPMGVFA